MVERKKRTRSVKKISRRTPTGEVVTHFKEEKKSPAKCGRCGRTVPPKNKKIYGGTLCSDCTAEVLRYAVQWKAKFIGENMKDLELSRDLTVERFLPKDWFNNLSRGVFAVRKVKPSFKKAKVVREEAQKPKVEKPKSEKKAGAKAKKEAVKKKSTAKKPSASKKSNTPP
jgi:ribosomal protein L34E